MEIKYPPSHQRSSGSSGAKAKGRGHYSELARAIGEEKKQKLKAATHKYVDLFHTKLSKVSHW